jgi:formylglycine-generating enzyme required for sulfatase activity
MPPLLAFSADGQSGEPANLVPQAPSAQMSALPMPPLRSFEFETVTVDSSGRVTNRRKGQARYFTEDINGVGLEMVEVPGGTFLMGTSDREASQVAAEHKRYTDDNYKHLVDKWVSEERPQHTVTVPTIYMGKYEVTQAQWRAVARLPMVNRDLVTDPSRFEGDNLPVHQVSWEDAEEFCKRLSRATGRQYRLPTEAEWEYACRAGTTSQFALGDTITQELVIYNGTYPYSAAPKGTIREQPNPVGGIGIANAFGLFDMHGNMMEWCLDTWHENYNGAPSDGRVWEGGDTRSRVVRGGSWVSGGISARAASRLRLSPSDRWGSNGFRVVAAGRTR